MKIVKTKSIPNVDVVRLRDSLDQIHAMAHTPAGLHAYSDSRRSLIEFGVKGRRIAARIYALTGDAPDCRYCWGGPEYSIDMRVKSS